MLSATLLGPYTTFLAKGGRKISFSCLLMSFSAIRVSPNNWAISGTFSPRTKPLANISSNRKKLTLSDGAPASLLVGQASSRSFGEPATGISR